MNFNINNDITNMVKIWLGGNYKYEHIFEQQVATNADMITAKKYFYDLIMSEIQKQLDTTDIKIIIEKLNGELNVFFDETGILACISHTEYYSDSDNDID
jgi:DNA helicase HerA-like ATPase